MSVPHDGDNAAAGAPSPDAESPASRFDYDAFLSYASEDREWVAQLAERLRNEGVRVWFDQWHIQPGHNIDDRINDGLEKSSKLVAVWTEHYFAARKVWTLAESYATQHKDVLGRERLLIPLLRRDCKVKPTLQGLLFIDCRTDADFDLRIRQILESLDLPKRDAGREEGPEFREHKLNLAERGRQAHRRGKRFEDEVATLYRLLNFDVKQDIEVSGVQMDLSAEKREGGAWQRLIVECKDTKVDAGERDKILARQALIQRKLPKHRVVAVSSIGFAAETRAALDDAGVDCTTFPELLHDLVPLDTYAENLIAQIESEINDPDKGWAGRDLFIRPDLEVDVTYECRPALAHFARWLGDPRANFLVVLGDLGTGKTTLSRFLAYQLARNFRDDPLRHPAPVLIPLRDVRREVCLDGIVTKHFRDRGLSGLNYPRFEHLLRQGRIVLFFDAFDEMADRIRWEVTEQNFQELRRATEGSAKVVLTCRTHYFKDRTEQARAIGLGPSLTAAETALYKELRRQSNAEIVYLQEFNDAQIQEYLHRTRGKQAGADWEKIQTIYNLKDLASRPLLLDMIVKSLPHLKAGEEVNAASLYTVYTNLWVERDHIKGRVVLTKDGKLALMMEIASWMWQQGKLSVTTAELVDFVGRLHAGKALEFGEEEADDICREVQAASFLRRNHKGGEWQFMHRSFGEFFLARKILKAVPLTRPAGTFSPTGGEGRGEGDSALRVVLNTRRLDRKVIFFLTLLDEQDTLRAPLQAILTAPYTQNLSENALQILYWSGRVRCGAEEKIEKPEELTAALQARIPVGVQLAGAQLQEIVLEHATFQDADFTGADLTKANLNGLCTVGTRFIKAVLRDARAEKMNLTGTTLRGAGLDGAALSGMSFAECDFSETEYEFLSSTWKERVWLDDETMTRGARLGDLQPIVQLGSASIVNAIAWRKKADLLAVGGCDGVIRLYRAIDGRLLRTLEGHQKSVESVAFDSTGQTLASGSDDNTVKLWEPTSGKLLRTLEGHQSGVQSVAFDPTGQSLASGSSDKSIKLWDTASGKLLRTLEGHQKSVESVAFDPTGQTLSSGGWDTTVKLWDPTSGRLLRTLEGHTNSIASVAFNPTGQTLASGSEDTTIKLWDPINGKLLRTLKGHRFEVQSVAFDPTGQILASGSWDATVKLWEPSSAKLLRTVEGHEAQAQSVAFDPTGQILVSGSADSTVKLWERASGKLLRTIEGNYQGISSLAFDPTGQTLASGSWDSTVKLWDPTGRKLLRTFEGHQSGVQCVAFNPTGQSLASGSADNTVKLWEPTSGKLLRTLEGHQKSVQSVAFDPTGQFLATGSHDTTVKLWDPNTGKLLRTLEGHKILVASVVFDATGKTVASGGWDKLVKLWDPTSGELLHTLQGHQGWVDILSFDPKGQILASGSWDNTVKLWESSNGKLLRTLEGHKDNVKSVAFDEPGKRLASGSSDHTVKLWEATSGKLLCTLENHLGPVQTVKWAPNGRYLVAAGSAGRLQFWDLEKLETFLYLYSFGPGAWLALLPDGRFDGTPDALRYLCYIQRGTVSSFTAEELVDGFHNPKAVQEVLGKYGAPTLV